MTVDGALAAEVQARLEAAGSSVERAVWSLVLGDVDVLPHGDPGPIGAMGTLVAGQRADARRVATEALADVDRLVTGPPAVVAAMLSLIAGDDERAASELDASGDRGPPELAEVVRALVRADAAAATALDALLASHTRRARAVNSELSNSWRGVVCLEAAAALVLAQERDVRVPVSSAHRATPLRLRAVHLLEWDGRPIPRQAPLDLTTDLVAGPWLRRAGVPIDDPPPVARATARRASKGLRRRADLGPELALEELHRRLGDGRGHPWQIASWATMVGDVDRARSRLREAAADARSRWHGTRNVNHNVVREHFAYALAAGDDRGVEEAGRALVAADVQPRFAHANGALDLVAELTVGSGRASRDEAERVTSPLHSTRVACVGLVARDSQLVADGLEGMLAEHAKLLERKSSPPPPVCEWAVYVLAAAGRLGIDVGVDEAWAAHDVPIELRELTEHKGRVGRLPCDVLGRPLVT